MTRDYRWRICVEYARDHTELEEGMKTSIGSLASRDTEGGTGEVWQRPGYSTIEVSSLSRFNSWK